MAYTQNIKIEKFLSAIRQEQEKHEKDTERETQLMVAEELEKAENEVLRESYNYIQRGAAQIRIEMGKLVSAKINSNNIEFLRHREEIFNEVIDITRNKLKKFTESSDYSGFIEKSVKNIAGIYPNKQFTFYIAEHDLTAKNIIGKEIQGSSIETDSAIKIGGIKAIDSENKLIIDDTLDLRLENEKETLRQNGELVL